MHCKIELIGVKQYDRRQRKVIGLTLITLLLLLEGQIFFLICYLN